MRALSLVCAGILLSSSVFAAPEPYAKRDSYTKAECARRIATLRTRMRTHLDARRVWLGAMERLPFGTADDDVIAPTVRVTVISRRAEWHVEVDGGGKRLRFGGDSKIAQSVSEVKKRLPAGERIAIVISESQRIEPITPLLEQLSRLGPLAISMTVPGARHVVERDDAPRWALDRLDAYRNAGNPDAFSVLDDAMRSAAPDCPAYDKAARRVFGDRVEGDRAEQWLKTVPLAVKSCACRGADIDALELFAASYFASNVSTPTIGWKEFRVTNHEAREVISDAHHLRFRLAKMPRDKRVAGLSIR